MPNRNVQKALGERSIQCIFESFDFGTDVQSNTRFTLTVYRTLEQCVANDRTSPDCFIVLFESRFLYY